MKTQPTERGSDASAADDANGRGAKEDVAIETKANKDGSRPRRESENNAAKLPAEAAGRSKGLDTALVSGVIFLIKVVKVRQPFHCQAVFVFFAWRFARSSRFSAT